LSFFVLSLLLSTLIASLVTRYERIGEPEDIREAGKHVREIKISLDNLQLSSSCPPAYLIS
jgi:hypothetical protein